MGISTHKGFLVLVLVMVLVGIRVLDGTIGLDCEKLR